jgi:hypothetical protein
VDEETETIEGWLCKRDQVGDASYTVKCSMGVKISTMHGVPGRGEGRV